VKKKKALDVLDEALKINRHNAEIFYQKGYMFMENGQFKEALENVQMAIEINNDNPEFYWLKGTCLHGLLKFSEAIKACDEAITCEKKRSGKGYVQAIGLKCQILKQIGRFKDASSCLDEALSVEPRDFYDYEVQDNIKQICGKTNSSCYKYYPSDGSSL